MAAGPSGPLSAGRWATFGSWLMSRFYHGCGLPRPAPWEPPSPAVAMGAASPTVATGAAAPTVAAGRCGTEGAGGEPARGWGPVRKGMPGRSSYAADERGALAGTKGAPSG
ncbi:hypothetical protein JCM13210_11220 [Thermaerobacter litoralis]